LFYPKRVLKIQYNYWGIYPTLKCPQFRFFVEINSLRQVIYDTAGSLKKGRVNVMGERIPSSFISLIDRIEKRKREMHEAKQLPIIRREEFDAMVKENSLQCRRDIQESMDVRDATIFLRERGIPYHHL
jgi:hypothetical protein